MKKRVLAVCAITLLSGCMKQPPPPDPAIKAKHNIQLLFDRWKAAFEAKDVNGVMSIYAPGATLTAYDVVPPLQFKGADEYRKDYSNFFAQFDGPIRVEVPDMHIEAGPGVAFVYGLERMTGKLKDGTPIDMWMRYTEGLKYMNGQWRVVHEHISVPADLTTGKASLDLKP
jgi:ketosteroid isomerase-like protein